MDLLQPGGGLSFDAVLGEHSKKRQTLSFPMVIEGVKKAFEAKPFNLRDAVVALQWRAPIERPIALAAMALHKEILELTKYEQELAAEELMRQRIEGMKAKKGKKKAKTGDKAESKKKKESSYEKKKREAAEERQRMMDRLAAEEQRRLKEEAAAKDLEAATKDAQKKAGGDKPEQFNMEFYMKDKSEDVDKSLPDLPPALGEKYEAVGFLGQGGFASVYSVSATNLVLADSLTDPDPGSLAHYSRSRSLTLTPTLALTLTLTLGDQAQHRGSHRDGRGGRSEAKASRRGYRRQAHGAQGFVLPARWRGGNDSSPQANGPE